MIDPAHAESEPALRPSRTGTRLREPRSATVKLEPGSDVAANRESARALARGVGGALLFAFPLLMTMEMWQLGFAIERGRVVMEGAPGDVAAAYVARLTEVRDPAPS